MDHLHLENRPKLQFQCDLYGTTIRIQLAWQTAH